MAVSRAFWFSLLMGVAGCGSGDRMRLASATGTVTAHGKPVAGASVLFEPEVRSASTKLATGRTDQAGKFTLFTDDRPGAGLGVYRVAIVEDSLVAQASVPNRESGVPSAISPTAATAKQIAEKYANPGESGLSYTVTAGPNNFDIRLDPP